MKKALWSLLLLTVSIYLGGCAMSPVMAASSNLDTSADTSSEHVPQSVEQPSSGINKPNKGLPPAYSKEQYSVISELGGWQTIQVVIPTYDTEKETDAVTVQVSVPKEWLNPQENANLVGKYWNPQAAFFVENTDKPFMIDSLGTDLVLVEAAYEHQLIRVAGDNTYI